MQLKELKNRVNRTVNDLSRSLHGRKKLIRRISIIVAGSILLFAFILGGIFFRDLAVLVRNKLGDRDGADRNPIIKMAETEYSKGYLENSALYYQTYLNDTDIDKTRVEKILAHKRLAEISLLRGQLPEALLYLDEWQQLDSGNAQVVVLKLKLLYRLEQFTRAKALINSSSDRFKKAPEFIEAEALYFLFLKDYKNALLRLRSIPFKKREYSTHRKIIHSYIYLNQLTNCLVYISKIEPKIHSFSNRELRYELDLLKNIALMLQGDYQTVSTDLERFKVVTKQYSPLIHMLIVKSRIILDDEEGLSEYAPGSDRFIALGSDFWLLMADFYTYKSRYQQAIHCYQAISEVRLLSREELMIVSDLYIRANDYSRAATANEMIMKEYHYRQPIVYKNLSAVHGRMGDFASEIFFLKEGLVQYPSHIDFNVRLAAVYAENNDPFKALEFITMARNRNPDSGTPGYDRRLDLLYVLLLEQADNPAGEQELLELREKGIPDPEYYFKLIEHYLKRNQLLDAHREIDTAQQLPLSAKQIEILACYQLLWADAKGNSVEYEKQRNKILGSKDPDPHLTMNRAILYIEEGSFEKAHEILAGYQSPLFAKRLVAKARYLRAVAYLYQGKHSMALKLVGQALKLDPISKKANYLKNVILHETGERSDQY